MHFWLWKLRRNNTCLHRNKYTYYYKRKNYNFIMETLCNCSLTNRLRLASVTRAIVFMYTWYKAQSHLSSVVFFQRIHNLNLVTDYDLIYGHKIREGVRNCNILQERNDKNRTWMKALTLGPWTEKKYDVNVKFGGIWSLWFIYSIISM
jgi:hypothetical protein